MFVWDFLFFLYKLIFVLWIDSSLYITKIISRQFSCTNNRWQRRKTEMKHTKNRQGSLTPIPLGPRGDDWFPNKAIKAFDEISLKGLQPSALDSTGNSDQTVLLGPSCCLWWWQLKYVLNFTLKIGEDESILMIIFFRWIGEKPSTSCGWSCYWMIHHI